MPRLCGMHALGAVLLVLVLSQPGAAAAVGMRGSRNITSSSSSRAVFVGTRQAAEQLGLAYLEPVGSLPGAHFVQPTHPSHHRHLLQEPKLRRSRRSGGGDPDYAFQWNLKADPLSYQIEPLWSAGWTGSGVVVSIVDDGLERTHPDLIDNYDPAASHDYNDNDDDPMPRYTPDNINEHGTRCAGVVSAGRNNGQCGVGIAYKARIGGVRMLDGPILDSVEGASLSFAPQHVDIYSCSWGPDDDGSTMEGPGPLAQNALFHGANLGRNGLGNIFVWAAGNGGNNDDCNADGYANNIRTITVNAVDQQGRVPTYAEPCAAALTSAFSSGSTGQGVVSCSIRNTCTTQFSGTSAAAPSIAGILALVLQAQPCLTWRDVQNLIVQSSTSALTDTASTDWHTNGAGYAFHAKLGFGVLNATKIIEKARLWQGPTPHQAVFDSGLIAVHRSVKYFRNVVYQAGPCLLHSQTGANGSSSGQILAKPCMGTVEMVAARVQLSQVPWRGLIGVKLTSPAGTQSQLLHPRSQDTNNNSTMDWTMSTTHFWGENQTGDWVLSVQVSDSTQNVTWDAWSLTFYGSLPKNVLDAGGPLVSGISFAQKGAQCLSCPPLTSYVDSTGQCRACSSACANGCFGPGPNACALESPPAYSSPKKNNVPPASSLAVIVIFGLIALVLVVLLVVYRRSVITRCSNWGRRNNIDPSLLVDGDHNEWDDETIYNANAVFNIGDDSDDGIGIDDADVPWAEKNSRQPPVQSATQNWAAGGAPSTAAPASSAGTILDSPSSNAANTGNPWAGMGGGSIL